MLFSLRAGWHGLRRSKIPGCPAPRYSGGPQRALRYSLLSILISVPELVVAPSIEATTTASTRTRAAARARKVGALGTSLIHRQLAILQYLAVQPSDGLVEVCAFG